jgi:hypothetical protein
MENITKIVLLIIAIFVLICFFSDNSNEHLSSDQSYVPANYQNVGGLNYLKLSDALYAPNMLSSSILSANVLANTVNAGNVNANNVTAESATLGQMTLGGVVVNGQLIQQMESDNSSLAKLVNEIQSEMNNYKPTYNANGGLSNTNLIQNIKFASTWSDSNSPSISNDDNNNKTLMIVGNKAKSEGKGIRTVGIWDELNVNGQLNVTGSFNGQNPNVLDWVGQGIFRADKKNKLQNQYIMANPGDNDSMPSILSNDIKGRGFNISTQGNGPILLNGRNIIGDIDAIKAKLNI